MSARPCRAEGGYARPTMQLIGRADVPAPLKRSVRGRLSTKTHVTASLRLDTECMNSRFVTPDREGTPSGRAERAWEMSDKTGRVLGWVGIVLHSTFVALQYYLSLLVMPPWAAYVLWGFWALLLLLAVHLLMRRSAWALAVPFAAFGLWLAAVTLGERLMGWTA